MCLIVSIYSRSARREKCKVFQEFTRPHSFTVGGGFGRDADLAGDFVERNLVNRLKEDLRLRFDGSFWRGSWSGAVAI